MTDMVDQIVRFESGEMSEDEILSLFSELIRSGLAWQLQGTYGRAAASLIENGVITPEGVIVQ